MNIVFVTIQSESWNRYVKIKLKYSPIIGAMLAAGIIGFVEAQWLLNTTGTPDKLSAIYGPVLYSILAVPFGVLASIVFHFIGGQGKLQGRGMGPVFLYHH